MIITKEYLRNNPNDIFVYGDNTCHRGKGGAAALRDEPNTYGFITKRYPSNEDDSFFTPEEYESVFNDEMKKLKNVIEENTNKRFLISKLGSGLANRFSIFENVIYNRLIELERYNNVILLF